MGDDEAALQARIAALAGTINKHKQQPFLTHAPHHVTPHHLTQHHRGNSRWAPYARGGARGGFPHKNRTLVLRGAQSPITTSPTAPPNHGVSGQEPLVSTRGRRANQLLNKKTYAREQTQKAETKEQSSAAHDTQVVPVSTRDSPSGSRPASRQARILEIKGVRFELQEDGSKLLRLPDQSAETPKKHTISGVEFLRTKHGNLIRASKQNDAKRPTTNKPKTRCENFTRHGTCPFGPGCRFAHIPLQVAICKDFLRTGTCSAGQNCNLSHDPTYHRVPACTHFLRGNCTNSACRYPHVNASPSTRVCRPFATLGYCPKGPDCDSRHVIECPDYSNHGRCASLEKGSCQLPHIDHAATLRKIARRQAKNGAEDESDLSSSDEENEPDQHFEEIDSDEVEEDVVMGSDDHSHALSQQPDFVSFS